MKKTLALLGAGTLGVAAGGAGVLPAAADATVECETIADHNVTTESDPGNWFMDCIPQYGLGKAEFTIVPDLDDPSAEFPEGFADLDATPPVSYTTTTDLDALHAYFGDEFPAPILPSTLISDAPNEQEWGALVIAPVTGVAAVTGPDIPDSVRLACDLDELEYGGGWVATFGAVDTTFTQDIDGESWSFEVTGTPAPVFYFGTIVGDDQGAEISTGDPWCIADGFGSFSNAAGGAVPGEFVNTLFGLVYHGLPDETEEVFPTFGTFGRFQAAPPAPALAATGAGDPLAPMIAGGVLALFGTALVGLTGLLRRRKQA